MFVGKFVCNLDDKGRLYIPKEFRAELRKGIVMRSDCEDRYLSLCPPETWERFKGDVPNTYEIRGYEADRYGRIDLPDTFMSHISSRPRDSVLLIGMLNNVEILNISRLPECEVRTPEEWEEVLRSLYEMSSAA